LLRSGSGSGRFRIGSGSGQKSSGSATLLAKEKKNLSINNMHIMTHSPFTELRNTVFFIYATGIRIKLEDWLKINTHSLICFVLLLFLPDRDCYR
jgi:hypothetical protein